MAGLSGKAELLNQAKRCNGRLAPKLTVTQVGEKTRDVMPKLVLPALVLFSTMILNFMVAPVVPVAQAALDPVKWGASRALARPHLTVSSVNKFGPPNLFKRPGPARSCRAGGFISGFCIAGREFLLSGGPLPFSTRRG